MDLGSGFGVQGSRFRVVQTFWVEGRGFRVF